MSFRFQKRINLGKGIGLNISKSGISPSVRTKRGSISTKGFSVNTGISGVNYRKNFSKSKNNGCLLFLVAPFIIIVLSILKSI
jgi:hypothetical protein